ncbi:MAG: signal peptidase I [Lentisphaerae bacterium]|nr:signal peptidase I [Lentisphaerota bacterium]
MIFPVFRTKWWRLAAVALGAYLFFGHVCLPLWIRGSSMEPTYRSRGLTFCWRPSCWFGAGLKRGDVVAVRLAGLRVMYLKRIVAFEGETVEFRDGRLWLDGKRLDEPYVKYPCSWNLEPRRVEPGNVYVVGDNRSVPMENHAFGQTNRRRVMGRVLW